MKTPSLVRTPRIDNETTLRELSLRSQLAIYFAGSLTIGIVMSKLVEYPVLLLRDRLFPDGHILPVAPTPVQ